MRNSKKGNETALFLFFLSDTVDRCVQTLPAYNAHFTNRRP